MTVDITQGLVLAVAIAAAGSALLSARAARAYAHAVRVLLENAELRMKDPDR